MVSRRKKFWIRWQRAGMWLRSLVLALAAIVFSSIFYFLQPGDEEVRGRAGVLVYTLINLNVVILCILAFLIGRNVVKLIFDRRRGILGAKLRTKLVVAFVGLTLIPTILVFILASGLLTQALEGWFSVQIESAVDGSVEVAKVHFDSLKTQAQRVTELLKRELSRGELARTKKDTLIAYLESFRKEWGLYSITIRPLQAGGEIRVESVAASLENFREPPFADDALSESADGNVQTRVEDSEGGRFIRVYLPLEDAPGVSTLLLTSTRVQAELLGALEDVTASRREYAQLKMVEGPLKSGYVLTLAMITGLLLFSAIWMAFYLARELVGPIQRLAEATRAVAKGSYDVRIREVGDDEFGFLVRSFNQMTLEIKASRAESERRRNFIETVLANLAVGVITLDTNQRVLSVNAAAARILGLSVAEKLRGVMVIEAFPAEVREEIKPLLELAADRQDSGAVSHAVVERQVALPVLGRELKVICTVGSIRDSRGSREGYVLLLDDVTELSKAQHLSAWREVAQRIAHEIKNPLTPILLSAQRLQKLLAPVEDGAGEGSTVREKVSSYADTIVSHVESIKRLANEFSHFARMPQADRRPTDLNALVSTTLEPYASSHSHITFQFIAGSDLPQVDLDQEQVRRAIINLIDNSLAAFESPQGREVCRNDRPRITIRTRQDPARRTIILEIADNGPGIRPDDRAHIFEPYFTTKKSGTGLGLAIVTTIVSEHHGEIRVYDQNPHGARFVIELPLVIQKATQRRFGREAGQ